jgi:hypothetical protein
MLTQNDLITVDGLPAHPLIVHAVVVLLPLAAIGGLVIAARASWRRRFWLPVLVLAVLSVAAVPLATTTGDQLRTALDLPDNQLIARHADLGEQLLPFAIAFVVAVLLLVVTGRLADRERDAARTAAATDPATDRTAATGGTAVATAPATTGTLWRRVAIVAAALVALTGVAAAVQVVRIGHSGSTAVWDGVGGN